MILAETYYDGLIMLILIRILNINDTVVGLKSVLPLKLIYSYYFYLCKTQFSTMSFIQYLKF